MSVNVFIWITFILAVHWTTNGNAYSDIERCESKEERDLKIFRTVFCLASKNNIEIACQPEEFIVIKSLNFATKENVELCNKRILSARDIYCCQNLDNDVLYDGDCLQYVWSAEDQEHYRTFMITALQKCADTSFCSLSSGMFKNIQREIPTTTKYASYIQVGHQCTKGPMDPVSICSSSSKSGNEIHLQTRFTSRENGNMTCTCSVQAQTTVTVKAIDVRTTNSRLTFKSNNRATAISRDQLPLFGNKKIFTGRNFDIRLEKVSSNLGEFVWLQLTGSDGRDITIVCGEQAYAGDVQSSNTEQTVRNTPRVPGLVTSNKKNSDGGGYSYMIYAAIGSALTIVLTVVIFGSYFICRYCMKKGRHPYEKPTSRQFSGHYDAVYGGRPHPPDHVIAPEWENTGAEMPHGHRTSTMRSLHKPMAPTLPPPNNQGRNLDEANSGMDVFFQN